jgi:hypothetical protein
MVTTTTATTAKVSLYSGRLVAAAKTYLIVSQPKRTSLGFRWLVRPECLLHKALRLLA